jgi:hypothetical protein
MAPHSPLTRDDADARPTIGTRSAGDRTRLGAYAAFAAWAGAIPLPWLPDSLVGRVRGALVHDVAVRHGLSLTPDARELLSRPTDGKGARTLASQAMKFLGVRLVIRALARLGPIAMVWPLREAVRTYALGHLFDRYLELGRTERAVRIDDREARRVRRAIDHALVRAMTVEAPAIDEPAAIDDQRDPTTALVDGLIGLAANVPIRLIRRLDAAFDDLLTRDDG